MTAPSSADRHGSSWQIKNLVSRIQCVELEEGCLSLLLLGFLWFFGFIWAVLVLICFSGAGNTIGALIYSKLLSFGFLSKINIRDSIVVITNTRIICVSLAFSILPLLDRDWMKNVYFVRGKLSDLKAFALCCALLLCYAAIALRLIYTGSLGRNMIDAYDGTLWIDMVFVIGGLVAAPVGEEILFRGWMWGRIEVASGPYHAALLSAVAWLALHLSNVTHVLMLLPLAGLLAFLRLRTASLLPGILLHLINNALEVACFVYLVNMR